MDEARIGVSRVFLLPAEAILSESPTQVRTVLGSCVAVTMRAPRLGLAAAAHCIMPTAGVPAEAMAVSEALKYVDTAIDLMLLAFARFGATRGEIEVKLFGGADSVGAIAPADGYSVGSRNVESALAALGARGMVATASDLGGRQGRVIDFDTATGTVLVRLLPARAERGRA
jgi:chemotaxis protein CheD